jgi:hypothetical protein
LSTGQSARSFDHPSTEEVIPMSTTDSGSSRNQGVKTLGIRLEGDRHAKLSMVAQLRERSINDEVQEAIDSHIAKITADPEWASKADQVLRDIERDAANRRNAFASLFGETPASPEPATAKPRSNRSEGDSSKR